MTSAKEIVDFASEALSPILDESGYVLYSSAGSLNPCPIYLLGCNPGGSPEDQAEAHSARKHRSTSIKNNEQLLG